MTSSTLRFLAVAASIMYGVCVPVVHHQGFTMIGAGLVACLWTAVGMLGRRPQRPRDETATERPWS